MKGKKIILFIVEGITDQICLGFLLSRILNSNKVEFALTEGDITSKTGINSNNVPAKIGEIVKKFSGSFFKANDFAEIVHLVDMDGAYILDEQIVEKTAETPLDPDKPQKPYYGDNQIFVDNPEAIRQRNHQKTSILNRLISLQNVWRTIPYSVYFFSCNLDHIMYGQRNLLKQDKQTCAVQFDRSYGDSPQQFIAFLNTPEIAAQGNYEETWDFIRAECNSLKRYTNFNLFFLSPKNPR
ncbi:MAG: hypothetical protein A4E53_01311 [Pelotomaculum sp. PtaB.Bin104]|nr:MAG: hypothetical protein A4E53_01311 [Pelotomaculum sp. PtaB.Bin104]